MSQTRLMRAAALGAAVAGIVFSGAAHAQSWKPTRNVELVIPATQAPGRGNASWDRKVSAPNAMRKVEQSDELKQWNMC